MFLGLTCNDLHGDETLKGILPRCDRNYDCPTTAGSDKKTTLLMDGPRRNKNPMTHPWESRKPWIPYMGPLDDRDTSKMDKNKLRYHYMSPTPPQDIPDARITSWPSPCVRRDGLQDPARERKCLEQEACEGYWRHKQEKRPMYYQCNALPPLCVCGYTDGTKKLFSPKPRDEYVSPCGGPVRQEPGCQRSQFQQRQDAIRDVNFRGTIFNIVPNVVRQEGKPKEVCVRPCGGPLPQEPECHRSLHQRRQDATRDEHFRSAIYNIVPNAVRQEGNDSPRQRNEQLARETLRRRAGLCALPSKCTKCGQKTANCICSVPKCLICLKAPSKCCCDLPKCVMPPKCVSCCSKKVCFSDGGDPGVCKVICKEKIFCPPECPPECRERQLFEKEVIKERRYVDPIFAPQPPYKPIYIPVCKPVYVPVYKPACPPVCKIVCEPSCTPCPPMCSPCPPMCSPCPPMCSPCPPMCSPCPPMCSPCPPMCSPCPPACSPCPPACMPCATPCPPGINPCGVYSPACFPCSPAPCAPCGPVCGPVCSPPGEYCAPTCEPCWVPAGQPSCPVPCAPVTMDGRPGYYCTPQNVACY